MRPTSPFSSLFDSSFLHEEASDAWDDFIAELVAGPRRVSLPSDAGPTASVPKVHSPTEDSSAFYLTLQPRRDNSEFRSFLSLDLAESIPMRSLSLQRRQTTRSRERISKPTSYWSNSFKSTEPIDEAPLFPRVSFIPSSSSSRRQFRHVPQISDTSTRPVPSSTPRASIYPFEPPSLPHEETPIFSPTSSTTSDLPPSLPPLRSSTFNPIPTLAQITLTSQLTLITDTSPLSPSSSSFPVTPTQTPTTPTPVPTAPTPVPTTISIPPPQRRRTFASQSSASTTTRIKNRSDTLAVLEGRAGDLSPVASPCKVPPRLDSLPAGTPPPRLRTFISMFDDEEADAGDVQVEAEVEDDDDEASFIMSIPDDGEESSSSDDNDPRESEEEDGDDEEEITALAPRTCVSRFYASTPGPTSCFAGVSFIDWSEDKRTTMTTLPELKHKSKRKSIYPKTRNWRNFVEIAGA